MPARIVARRLFRPCCSRSKPLAFAPARFGLHGHLWMMSTCAIPDARFKRQSRKEVDDTPSTILVPDAAPVEDSSTAALVRRTYPHPANHLARALRPAFSARGGTPRIPLVFLHRFPD